MKKLFVCTLAVAMVIAFTAPTMAAEWNFYGSARMQTYSVDVDPDIEGVDDGVRLHVAEQADLATSRLLHQPVGSHHDGVRLDAAAAQLGHRVALLTGGPRRS